MITTLDGKASSDVVSESTSIGTVEPTDSKSTASSPETWSWSRRLTRWLSRQPVPASDVGSSEMRASPRRSARQLAAQASATPCSASGQAPLGEPGWLRSLGRKRVPVQNRSPDDGAPGPMVGAKCRVVGATYANGWLIIVGANKTSPVPGSGMRRRHACRRILPSFRALRGYNTPTAALRGLRMVTRSTSSYKRLLELFGERMKKGKASPLLLSMWCLELAWIHPLHGCPGRFI